MKKQIINLMLLCSMAVSAQVNNALSFDGFNDQVVFNDHALKEADDFTIEAMVLNENPTPDANVFMQFYDEVDTRFELRFDQGKLALYSQKLDLSSPYISSFTVPQGKYFHLALVKQGTVTKLYANYTEVLSVNGAYSLGKTLRLGSYFVHDIYSFKGKIDELRMWNVAKTAAQIKYAPKCGLKGDENNLVGYWTFDEGLAYADNYGIATLYDLTTYGNNGLLSNFALTGSSSNWIASGTGCNERKDGNNALSFDGVDDNVRILDQPLKDANNFTIDAMILNENTDPDTDVFVQFYDETDTRFELRLDQGKLALYCQKLNYYDLYISSYTVPVGTYFHLAMVKNGSVTKLYADGKEVLTVNGDYSLGSTLRLGRYFYDDAFSFKGKIDELRMWSIAKTPDNIKYTKKCGLTGNESHLVGYWNFNQGQAYADNSGSIVLKDLTPYKHDGTLYNFALKSTSSNWVASGTGCLEGALRSEESEETASLTAVGQNTEISELRIYPNPAKDWIEVGGDAVGATLQIHDLSGKLVLDQQLNGRLTLSETIQAGTYIVTVKKEKTSKFVLIKE